jgi:hypothetical protein
MIELRNSCTRWTVPYGIKVKAIFEFEKYTTLTVNKLFSKLKSAKVDRGLTACLESPTHSHCIALVGGKVTKSNANASSKMYSLSSLMSSPNKEFDVLGECWGVSENPDKIPEHVVERKRGKHVQTQ